MFPRPDILPPPLLGRDTRRQVLAPKQGVRRGRGGLDSVWSQRPAFWVLLGFALLLIGPGSAAHAEQLNVQGLLDSGEATLEHSALDIGGIRDVFDGNTSSVARSAAVNPMAVTLVFGRPQRLTRTRILYSAGSHRWKLEVADTLTDLENSRGTYRRVLDWESASGDVWRERGIGTTTECQVARLTLERNWGDDYVHLYEWELFAEDRPFVVNAVQKTPAGLEISWESTAGRWYGVQASPDLREWKDVTIRKADDDTTTGTVTEPKDGRFARVRAALPEEQKSVTKKVLVLNIDPVIESRGGRRLNAVQGWNDTRVLTDGYLADLSAGSGGYLRWDVVHWVDLDHWPVKIDGFAYDDASFLEAWATRKFHDPDALDYGALLDHPIAQLGNRSAHDLAAAGEVDEVICWAFPYSGFYESRMVGRSAYFCNAPGLIRPSRLYVVMGLNPERGVAEALHSFGHRVESILRRVYGSWSGSSEVNHLWDRFTRIGPQHPGVAAACGNIHFPPNADVDYQYNAALAVDSEADDWLNFPRLTGATTRVSADTWGGPDHHRNFLRWWFARLPRASGRYTDPGNAANDGKLNNWWAYSVEMNEYRETR
jgi:hypothetical protein